MGYSEHTKNICDNVYVCMFVRMYVHMYACMHACTFVCVRMYVCVCMCTYRCINVIMWNCIEYTISICMIRRDWDHHSHSKWNEIKQRDIIWMYVISTNHPFGSILILASWQIEVFCANSRIKSNILYITKYCIPNTLNVWCTCKTG